MPYTRRDLIRDAALIAATGAVAGAPSILGCHAAPPKPKFSGVRVFFCGSWIFCSDGNKTKPGMLAIGRDMFDSSGSSTHIFPFGRWQNTTVPFDHGMPRLLANPRKSDGNGLADPYILTIDPPVAQPVSTVAGSPSPVECIFQQTQKEVRFPYLNNYKSKEIYALKIDTHVNTPLQKPSGIRIIALPIPKRIRARGLLTNATMTDKSNMNLLNRPTLASTTSNMDGLATTHIFEYDGASSLTFTAGSVTDTIYATEECIDYHFHTVPSVNMGDHGPAMFNNLLCLLSYTSPSYAGPSPAGMLSMSNPCPIMVQPGPDLPDGGTAELDYDAVAAPCSNSSIKGDLASCSGPGFGIGGNVIN